MCIHIFKFQLKMDTHSTMKVLHHTTSSECVSTFPCSLLRLMPEFYNFSKLQYIAMVLLVQYPHLQYIQYTSSKIPKCIGQSRQPRHKMYYCLYINGTKRQSMPVCTPLEIPRSSPEQLIHLGNRYTRTKSLQLARLLASLVS